jgi:hypothetical protein
MNINKLLKSLLQAGVYLVDQSQRTAEDVSERVKAGATDLGDRFKGGNHTPRYVLTFAAGVGVGLGAGMFLAPDSGRAVVDKVTAVGEKIKNRSSESRDFATGT